MPEAVAAEVELVVAVAGRTLAVQVELVEAEGGVVFVSVSRSGEKSPKSFVNTSSKVSGEEGEAVAVAEEVAAAGRSRFAGGGAAAVSPSVDSASDGPCA